MFPLVHFVRHGQTDWNAELRFQGQVEIDINDTGRMQARRNGRALAHLIDDPSGFEFVASPLRRTRETMELVRAEMGLPAADYRTDSRLVEVHFGDWQGFTIEEIEQARPGAGARRDRDKWGFLPPGRDAESYADLAARVRGWMDEIENPTVCVTHGGVIRAVFLIAGRLDRHAAAAMTVPQDRVLRLTDGKLEWL
ncbi:histidine phosphatase family protein [Nitratireductor sp. CAU 1489]|uniref:Histidine phosphatase family protein n=1 Tax=Nitratireductor arenosus TaxID=2682096 RepID=A0A844QL52_9HYPH|nr:histidine phosphatase family protein [Nitratireductor arenosus]MVA98778.1 histidine phosphatase family protein [Nitratireductor arenosus]